MSLAPSKRSSRFVIPPVESMSARLRSPADRRPDGATASCSNSLYSPWERPRPRRVSSNAFATYRSILATRSTTPSTSASISS